MTEKRFTIWDCNNMENILHTFVHDGDKTLTHQQCCDLLNEQSETIQQLKQENMELTLTCKPLFSKRQLHEENQHIKHLIKEAYENERTTLGKNVLKQLIESL